VDVLLDDSEMPGVYRIGASRIDMEKKKPCVRYMFRILKRVIDIIEEEEREEIKRD
jgi:hypothetical protein